MTPYEQALAAVERGDLRAVDALVAEHVMGWTDVEEYLKGYTGPVCPAFPPFELIGVLDGKQQIIHHYSTSIAAAWEVRDKIASLLFSRRQAFTNACREILSEELGSDDGIHFSEVVLRINPRVICLAALKTFNAE